MNIPVTFYSYFKDLTGINQATIEVSEGSTIGQLMSTVFERYPKMRSMERSTLIAVGVEYQDQTYILKPGDDVSLFPPVQGG